MGLEQGLTQIGQQVKMDMAVSIERVVELQRMAERDWEKAVLTDDVERMYRVAEWAT
jgi:hypothetical protein